MPWQLQPPAAMEPTKCPSGNLYAWGDGDAGQLGVLNETNERISNVFIPTKVHFPDLTMDGIYPIDIACGPLTSGCVMSNGNVRN